MQEGNSLADHDHVSKMTPLAVKKREVENDPQYMEGIDREPEKRTTRLRLDKEVKPI